MGPRYFGDIDSGRPAPRQGAPSAVHGGRRTCPASRPYYCMLHQTKWPPPAHAPAGQVSRSSGETNRAACGRRPTVFFPAPLGLCRPNSQSVKKGGEGSLFKNGFAKVSLFFLGSGTIKRGAASTRTVGLAKTKAGLWLSSCANVSVSRSASSRAWIARRVFGSSLSPALPRRPRLYF